MLPKSISEPHLLERIREYWKRKYAADDFKHRYQREAFLLEGVAKARLKSQNIKHDRESSMTIDELERIRQARETARKIRSESTK